MLQFTIYFKNGNGISVEAENCIVERNKATNELLLVKFEGIKGNYYPLWFDIKEVMAVVRES